jgi:hypothetical protein
VFHETNDNDGFYTVGDEEVRDPFIQKYDPKVECNAAMIRLKEFYASMGWEDFPHDPSYTRDSVYCPNCHTPYPGEDGKILTRAQTFCIICKKGFMNPRALKAHMGIVHKGIQYDTKSLRTERQT